MKYPQHSDLGCSVVHPTICTQPGWAVGNSRIECRLGHSTEHLSVFRTLVPTVDKIFSESDVSRIIEMAWEDRTPFEAIHEDYGLSEADVIRLMRREMKASSFRLWRARVSGRVTKHRELRDPGVIRGYCKTQYSRVKGKR